MQNELRNQLIAHIEKCGVTIAFIARKIGCKRQTLSNFKNGQTFLGEQLESTLIRYLDTMF